MTPIRRHSLTSLLLIAVISPSITKAQTQPPPVPAAYTAIYSLDQGYLDTFNATLNAAGAPPAYAGLQSGSLKAADCNAGPALLNSDPSQELYALKAMGVQAITVHVSFPMLYGPFLTSQGQTLAPYQAFYANLAQQIRSMGLKLIVESTAMFTSATTSQAGWDTGSYYATLDWPTYEAARAQTVQTIATTMNPDYLVVLEEPDTEAMNTGQTNVNTPGGANDLLSQILALLQSQRAAGMLVGAGVGTWLPNFQPFIQGFVGQPMDFVDMHIYPINNSAQNGNFLSNALTIASIAAGAGMPVSMTECWLHKELDSEISTLTPDQVSSRDVFSFWEPLDQYFLQTMNTMAGYTQMTYGNSFLFINPFSVDYFFAYQDYNANYLLTPAQLLNNETALVSPANDNVQYTPTGMAFYASNVPSDTQAPSAPPSLAANSANPTSATISWGLSTDNVGVAGYYLYRDGTLIATTNQMIPNSSPITIFYQDPNLAEASTHTYTVAAFDLAGNTSPQSAPVTVTTNDNTPPTTPGNVVATPVACTRVTLSWSPSTDNVKINQYIVYQGLSPNGMAQIGVTPGTTSFNNASVNPNTTYYFAVVAGDGSGNLSYMSTPVAVTTPALPATPTGVKATPNSGTHVTLTWSASTGGMPIAHYNVFRGSSPSTLAQVAQTTSLTYNDQTTTPGTTYYYAVQASDTGSPASQSGYSNPVAVTTYALPAPPSSVSAVAAGTTKMTVSWSGGGGNGLSIANYRVFRGLTPGALVQIATTTKASYTDQNLTLLTTYYYAVEVVDSGSPADVSPLSAAVPGTTDGLPGIPSNVLAVPVSSSKITVTWLPSVSGGLPVTNYHVYGGTSPSHMSQLAVTSLLTYSQSSLSPGTTYYYSVQAADSAGDLSAMSPAVSSSPYPLPSTPANVTVTPKSTTMMTVTWQPSTGSLPIKYYYVSRGTNPNQLSQIATTTTTTYTDKNLTPGTTYYYSIQAGDTAGDRSGSSAPVPGTTQP